MIGIGRGGSNEELGEEVLGMMEVTDALDEEGKEDKGGSRTQEMEMETEKAQKEKKQQVKQDKKGLDKC